MMYEFLTKNRGELITRCRDKVALRSPPGMPKDELVHGVTVFLDQLIRTLVAERGADTQGSRLISGMPGGRSPAASEISDSATRHGRELIGGGFTVEEVVHDYGDLCQAISDLAFETGTEIGAGEFRTLNRCLDNAIASAVTEYIHQRDLLAADRQAIALNERLGAFAHEMRNLLFAARLARRAIKAGDVGVNGATAGVLDRALAGMGNLIDRSLAEVRVTAGMPARRCLFPLAEFIAEINLSAVLEAQVKGYAFIESGVVDPSLALDADRDLMLAAVGNLLQNGFKFSRANGGVVSLRAHAEGDRILIEVEDNGEGLPADVLQTLFRPFSQAGENRSGLGLGLSISRRSVEANDGTLSVSSASGSGCVFTISMPRHRLS
ncbi:MAG: HAMP domain-containing histidine kinase [Gammaproteobacteria bacterium]|nr:HAMP domain-containing histidine kinase [Gammaproteobacteria bacterium]MBU0772719.1 HAMP domain-containing histidine kinase [Gammaproteobacteria bacterium]MBU0857949.1 HAMP domain-containing histidine kinase [Gammaproteobacteria bacterium]MBU1846754.1 HAMP domain-containing histidine kinase [Gammaproteobacteria bacterium]